MSEYERPDRALREPTMEDLHQLMGASTPHFALQLRNRISHLIARLPAGHPVRLDGTPPDPPRRRGAPPPVTPSGSRASGRSPAWTRSRAVARNAASRPS